MNGSDLTLLVAFVAGIVSFLSPCVLPLVPAYLGQLTVAAMVGGAQREAGIETSRWLALRHAIAYVAGFGLVFTLLGVTASFIGGGLFPYLGALRIIGGILMIVLGLNLAGFLPIPILDRTWRPLEAGAAGSLAAASGTMAFAPAGGSGVGSRLGGRLVGGRVGWLSSLGLGIVFAIGWTPCIGVILGGILTVAASSGQTMQGGALLLAYTLGLGLPFIGLAVIYDRAPAVVRPLVRHGRIVSIIGGLMVVALGVAMIFDWLSLLARLAPGV